MRSVDQTAGTDESTLFGRLVFFSAARSRSHGVVPDEVDSHSLSAPCAWRRAAASVDADAACFAAAVAYSSRALSRPSSQPGTNAMTSAETTAKTAAAVFHFHEEPIFILAPPSAPLLWGYRVSVPGPERENPHRKPGGTGRERTSFPDGRQAVRAYRKARPCCRASA